MRKQGKFRHALIVVSGSTIDCRHVRLPCCSDAMTAPIMSLSTVNNGRLPRYRPLPGGEFTASNPYL